MTTPGATEAVTPEQTVMSILRKITVLRCGLAEDSDSRILIGSIIERAIREAEANALRRALVVAEAERDRCHMLENQPNMPYDARGRYAARYVSSADIASAIRSLLPKEEGK